MERINYDGKDWFGIESGCFIQAKAKLQKL